MKNKFFRSVSILFLALSMTIMASAPQPALAAGPWYVAPGGNDNNTCLSPGTACATINGAIGKATSGDTIYVATGTYVDTGDQVILLDKDVTVSGGWDDTFTLQAGISTIDGEQSRRGITIYGGVSVTIEQVTVKNGAHHSGGGISLGGSSLTLNRSTVSENQQIGISAGDSTLILNDSTVKGNTNNSYGGGIYAYDSTVTINNSTISGNIAGSSCCWSGGGIYLGGNQGVGIINNSTITGNTAGVGGGIEYGGGFGSVTLQNTILAGNNALFGPDCSGTPLTSAGYNIVGNTSDCGMIAGTGDQFDVDPLLSTYSIGEPDYHALQTNSPAIDAGNSATCLSTDQRGIERLQDNACDIGAYEYTAAGQPTSILVVNGNNLRVAPNLPFPKSLEAIVIDSQGSPVPGVTVTFSAPISGPSGTFANSGTNVTTSNTNNSGVAIAPTFIANDQMGSYSVVATVSGVQNSATFTLANFAWYVSTTGDSANDCQSPTAPCPDIISVLERPDFASDDTILVAAGIYSNANTGGWGVLLQRGARLLGGWDAAFITQSGSSTLDGQGLARGITIFDVTAHVERFVIKNGVGGGIVNAGTLTVTNSSVFNNSRSDGGGIYNSGTLIVNNTTVSDNHAFFDGGGIYNFEGSLVLNNVTVAGNSSANRGGGLYTQSGDVTIRNSVLASNTSAIFSPDCVGTIAASDHNIIGNTLGCTLTEGTGDQFNVNPQLGPFLPDFGVSPLPSSSPAVDGGDPASCSPADQRGVTRVGICDIGAFEFTTPGPAASLAVAGGNNQITGTGTAFSNPLQMAALDNQGNLVDGVTIDFAAPAVGPSGIFADTGNNSTSVDTDANGVATASTFTANDQPGAYTVTASSTGVGVVNFSLEQIVRPANDLFSNAEAIASLPFTATVDITDSTNEPDEPQSCTFMERTVWYSFTPAENMAVRADALGGARAGNVNIYVSSGPGFSDLIFIACASQNDSVNLNFEAGETYYLQVGSAFGEAGSVQINLGQILPPANDNFTNAEDISFLPFNATVDLTNATRELDEPFACGSFFGTVWYSFTPVENVAARLNLVNSPTSSAVSVYLSSGHGISDLTFLTCAFQDNPVNFTFEAGRTYYLQVNPNAASSGNIQFNLEASGGDVEVSIDIKPGQFQNRIKLRRNVCRDNDNVYVAILTTPSFNARTVDVSSLQLGDPNLSGKVSPVKSRITDVDRDGDRDMVLTFTLCSIVTNGAINLNSTEMVLTGMTLEGVNFAGRDSVKIVSNSYP